MAMQVADIAKIKIFKGNLDNQMDSISKITDGIKTSVDDLHNKGLSSPSIDKAAVQLTDKFAEVQFEYNRISNKLSADIEVASASLNVTNEEAASQMGRV